MALKRLLPGRMLDKNFYKAELKRASQPPCKRDTDQRERRHVRTEHCQY